MRVDDLVSQGAFRQVWSLRDVEDLINCGFVDATAKHRPEFSQDTEERGLSAAVGPCDEQVHARLDTEIH